MGTGILDNSPLVRTGSKVPLTLDDVVKITSVHDAARAVVEAAGGITEFIRLTKGGTLPPEVWPFKLPPWPPVSETAPVDVPRVVGPSPAEPFTRRDLDSERLGRIETMVTDIHRILVPRSQG
jgi:hypothetical protein